MRTVTVYTDRYQTKVLFKGNFHRWGDGTYQREDNERYTTTVAIVEDEEGRVFCVSPECVKFRDIEEFKKIAETF